MNALQIIAAVWAGAIAVFMACCIFKAGHDAKALSRDWHEADRSGQ